MKKSGVAAAELLRREGARRARHRSQAAGRRFREAAALEIPFAVQTDAVFEDCDLIVLSPDVPADLPPLEAARERGVDGDRRSGTGRAFLKGRTIGITGSNGKTTTTSLTGHILREAGVPVQVGGNIGVRGRGHDRDLARRWLERAGALQLPTRDDPRVSRRCRASR